MQKARSITLTLNELAVLSSFLKEKQKELSELAKEAGQHEALKRLQSTTNTIQSKVKEALRDIEAELTQAKHLWQD